MSGETIGTIVVTVIILAIVIAIAVYFMSGSTARARAIPMR